MCSEGNCFSMNFENEESGIKSLDVLYSEIKSLNLYFPENELHKTLKVFQSARSVKQLISEVDLQTWAENVLQNKASNCEKIAFAWKAMEFALELEVRDIQVLTVLMMYVNHAERGRLAQVNTGEGKTIIIAMLAALLCFDGHQVDVVTTSPELAVPQSQQLEDFYRLLGLTSSNIDKGDKSIAYTCNVVYGSINEYEGDVLYDDFFKRKTRVGRNFDIVIIDEADSMLVDGINNMTRITSPMPGMNTLLPVLINIWNRFEIIEASTPRSEETGGRKAKRRVLEKICKTEEVDAKIEDDIRELIKSGKLHVPKHLIEFVLDHQLKIWIQSAFKARHALSLEREYVLEDGDVKIVDLHNSGIVFKNMKWSDGIHQFLQIKNNVQLTCEDLVTNYLANPTFFLKYKRVFGLTGTLGCNKTRKFLDAHYKTDSIIIPPFKSKLHIKFPTIVAENEDEWRKAIVDQCMTELSNQRAVLIIAESIAETNKIKHLFLLDGFNDIRMYQTEKDSEVCKHLVEPGQVIITTNICGRGVNIFPSPKATGGLHICLTFLPENSRVEEQNIGRTSRSGNPGTSQMILLGSGNLDDIVRQREERNAQMLERMGKDMEITKVKAEVFENFCSFLNKVESGKPPKHWKVRKGYFDQLQKEKFCDALKEQFSIWLKRNELSYDNNPKELLKQYQEFEETTINQFRTDSLVTENVFLFILSAVKCIRDAEYEKSVKQLTTAIEIDKNCSAFAYLNRAIALVALKKFKEAIADLEEARDGIDSLIRETEVLGRLAKKHSRELESKLNRQSLFLKQTVQSIRNVTGSGVLNESQVIQMQQRNQEIRLAFVSWLNDVPDQQKKVYKTDAVELVMRGWIGPIEVKYKELSATENLRGTVAAWYKSGCTKLHNGREIVNNFCHRKYSGQEQGVKDDDVGSFEDLE